MPAAAPESCLRLGQLSAQLLHPVPAALGKGPQACCDGGAAAQPRGLLHLQARKRKGRPRLAGLFSPEAPWGCTGMHGNTLLFLKRPWASNCDLGAGCICKHTSRHCMLAGTHLLQPSGELRQLCLEAGQVNLGGFLQRAPAKIPRVHA